MRTELLFLLGIIFVTTALLLLNGQQMSNTTISRRVQSLVQFKPNSTVFPNWIVITSIALKPTAAIKALAKETGWRMVIVGDTKGPHEPLGQEWNSLTNTVTVLTMEKQQQLRYKIFDLLPTKSYTRKMIGYLYAIEHGAKIIYDTDDDNQPIYRGLQMFDYNGTYKGMMYAKTGNESLFNPYAFFGRADIWPRGYPLSEIQVPNNPQSYKLCGNLSIPLIQQGLVDKDPDVDAIYRLIHAHPIDGLSEQFNTHTPPIAIDRGIFAPINSQNTLFHYEAFFTLALPIGVAFRVTDIWRGYFSQKLVQEIGGRIGFYPVNAVQVRNPHSYLDDFKDETALYHDADRLVAKLAAWSCTERSIELCTLQLSLEFVKNRFWTQRDHDLIEAWLVDLTRIGYTFPKIEKAAARRRQRCQIAAQQFMVKNNDQASIQLRANYVELMAWCGIEHAEKLPLRPALPADLGKQLKQTALVVTFNYPISAPAAILQRLYEGFFAHVIFCGTLDEYTFTKNGSFPDLLPSLSYINVTTNEIMVGYYAYICTARAIELRLQNIDGYITVADDAIYNFWNSVDFSYFRAADNYHYRDWNFTWWQKEDVGEAAILNSTQLVRSELSKSPNSELSAAFREFDQLSNGNGFTYLEWPLDWTVSDWFYLPKRHDWVFVELANVFLSQNVFHELAVPRLGTALGHKSVFIDNNPSNLLYEYVWLQNRTDVADYYRTDLHFLHPFKLSLLANETEKQMACEKIFKPYISKIWQIVV